MARAMAHLASSVPAAIIARLSAPFFARRTPALRAPRRTGRSSTASAECRSGLRRDRAILRSLDAVGSVIAARPCHSAAAVSRATSLSTLMLPGTRPASGSAQAGPRPDAAALSQPLAAARPGQAGTVTITRDTVHVTLGQLPAADRDRRVRRAVAMADLHPASIAGTQQILHTRLSKRHGLRRRPPAHIEVIAMTISRRPRLAGSGSPVRRALSSSVRACGICTTSRFTRGSALAVLPCAATLDAGSCRGAAAGSGAPPRSARRTGRPIPAAPLPTSHRHIGQLQPGRPADPRSQWAGPVLPDSSPPPGSRPDRQADQPIGFYELVC